MQKLNIKDKTIQIYLGDIFDDKSFSEVIATLTELYNKHSSPYSTSASCIKN